MKRMSLFLFIAAASAHIDPAFAGEVIIKSEQPYVSGRYAGFCGPWSRWIDHSITDYSNAMIIQSEKWPRDTEIKWRFPEKFPSTGVYGYNYVAYGQYWDLKPPVALTPKKFSQIKTLNFMPEVLISGDGSQFNVLAEFFVTKEAGKIGSRSAEIGWLLHTPPKTKEYFENGKQIGTYRDAGGRDWLVASHRDGAAGLYILFTLSKPDAKLTAPVDALASMKWLASRGEVDLDQYFNGMAIGIEPLKGAGRAVIKRFDVTFD